MNLSLIRHAAALPAGGGITRDADRTLDPRGIADAELMGRVLVQAAPAAVAVATSPVRRATQTAELLAQAYTPALPVVPVEALAPGVRHRELALELIRRWPEDQVLVVGHQPDLSHFISYLVADAAADIALPPAAVACLKVLPNPSHPEGTLLWILTPDLVRLLNALH